MPQVNTTKICKKCKRKFIIDFEDNLPQDIEFCSECRGDKYSDTAAKIAKAIETILKN